MTACWAISKQWRQGRTYHAHIRALCCSILPFGLVVTCNFNVVPSIHGRPNDFCLLGREELTPHQGQAQEAPIPLATHDARRRMRVRSQQEVAQFVRDGCSQYERNLPVHFIEALSQAGDTSIVDAGDRVSLGKAEYGAIKSRLAAWRTRCRRALKSE